MFLKYSVIKIFTSEQAKHNGGALWQAIINEVKKLKIAARVVVSKGFAGCYENGEVATNNIEILSYNMPVKIEIILTSDELNNVLCVVEDMVTDGIVAVEEMDISVYRTKKYLIPRQLRVRDVMTKSPKTVYTETPISEIIRILLSSEFNSVFVIDKDSKPIGIVTQGDLISRAGMPVRLGLLSQLEKDKVEDYLSSISAKTAGDIMTKNVISVEEDKMLGEAVDLMLDKYLKRLAVVDSKGKLTGVIARSDIFHSITKESPDWGAICSKNVLVEGVKFVRDIMRSDTQSVSPDIPIEEVVKIIDYNDIQRVAVVGEDGKLLGLISDRDILSFFSDHRAGLWDYLVRRLPFQELANKHKDLIEKTKAKTAKEVMKTDLIVVKEDTLIDEAVKIMADMKIKRLPVVDESGVFKGMVSRDSVLRAGFKSKE